MNKKAVIAAAVVSGLGFAGSLFAKMQLVHSGRPTLGFVVLGIGILFLVIPIIVLPRLKRTEKSEQ